MTNIFQTFGRSIDRIDSPRQLALGLALGCMIGFLPKDNLLFVGLVVCLIASGANLLTGTLAGLLVSASTAITNSFANTLGNYLLDPEYFFTPVNQFMQLPMAPWTRLDNTVVMGSLFLGLVAFIPVYLLGVLLFEKHHQLLQLKLLENGLVKWAAGRPDDEEA